MQESISPPPTFRHTLNQTIATAFKLKDTSFTLRSEESDLHQSLQQLQLTTLNTLETVHFDCDSMMSSLRILLHKEISQSRAQLGESSQSVRRVGRLEKEREALEWAERFVTQREQELLSDLMSPSCPNPP